jgi:ABC-type cobalamin/Fe3+-siderophores transport system ATPase subunit
VLKLEELGVRYGSHRAVQGVSAEIGRGDVVGLIGPNGSGKSTLLKALAGLLPYHGSVQWGGRELHGLGARERAAALSYLPQQVEFSQPFLVHEVVLMGSYARLDRWGREPASSTVRECLERVGIGELRERPVTSLSGGEAQRVRLAQALAQQAEYLLLDEPTSALDLQHQLELSALLRSLSGEGKTQMVALHDLNLARRLCSRLWLMERGSLRIQGTPEEVLASEDFASVFGVELEFFESATGERVVWPRKLTSTE